MLQGYEGLPIEEANVVRHGAGAMAVWMKGDRLITRAEGKMTLEGARAIESVADRLAAVGRQRAFHDWEALDDYETEARILLTNTGIRLRRVTDDIHVLTRSRIIAAAVNAARLILPNVRAYSARAPFEQALLQRRSSAPPASR